MRLKIVILLSFIFIGIANSSLAVSSQKKVFDGLLVESGTSTKNIMPLLANIAGRQQVYFKRKGYFKRLYGQYRGNYILIKMHSAGKIKSVKEIETIARQVTHNVITAYPSSEGRLEIIRSPLDFWDLMVIRFKNGKVIEKTMSPSTEIMQKRIQVQNLTSTNVINDKLTFDLISGSFDGAQIGISMSPEHVIKLIGKQPEDTRYDVFSYYKDGFEFSFSMKSGNFYCNAVIVFLQDYDAAVGYYKAFKGKINPLNKRENQKKILEKFKGCKNFTIEDIDTETLTYKTSYGKLKFFFNKNNGIVDTVDIRSK